MYEVDVDTIAPNFQINTKREKFLQNDILKLGKFVLVQFTGGQGIKLDSYDGLLNQRKNILAVVPKSNEDGSVIFETNTPIFIDLNNKNELLLRNIRCRVVRPDYSNIEMQGIATLVLLVDN